ncbi:hypothetical protein I8752_10620 [Nostocaceae cyanobacterium CENA369]|uniref:Uncharacterized protein n=1 Tax=Dendronalium phyllosphericum CENA369 TaxID=1725256 RepID=A0A8J7I2E4_9NOST|nr:hypothetical protein [Dendronalium phyllosphericum]MBH8573460.1 hypothetical protein [Dendronalium phyllosphericum CENA369]
MDIELKSLPVSTASPNIFLLFTGCRYSGDRFTSRASIVDIFLCEQPTIMIGK